MTSSKGPGRPLKFSDPAELQKKIDGYFQSCFKAKKRFRPEIDPQTKKVKLDEYLEPVGKFVPLLDEDGNQVLEQIKPFTISGLAVFLETSRKTLVQYEEFNFKNPDILSNTQKEEMIGMIKEAKEKIQAYMEEGLVSSKLAQPGTIFSLKNNYAWTDRTEVDVTKRDVTLTTPKDMDEDDLE